MIVSFEHLKTSTVFVTCGRRKSFCVEIDISVFVIIIIIIIIALNATPPCVLCLSELVDRQLHYLICVELFVNVRFVVRKKPARLNILLY